MYKINKFGSSRTREAWSLRKNPLFAQRKVWKIRRFWRHEFVPPFFLKSTTKLWFFFKCMHSKFNKNLKLQTPRVIFVRKLIKIKFFRQHKSKFFSKQHTSKLPFFNPIYKILNSMYNYQNQMSSYHNNFGTSCVSLTHRLSLLDFWQFWWWFWFITLLIFYFNFFFKGLESFSSCSKSLLVNSLFSCGRLGDLIVSIFPIGWCLVILTNSNVIFSITDWKTGTFDWNLRVYGKQWYWVYKLNPSRLFANTVSSKITFDIFYQTFIQNQRLSLDTKPTSDLCCFLRKYIHSKKYNYKPITIQTFLQVPNKFYLEILPKKTNFLKINNFLTSKNFNIFSSNIFTGNVHMHEAMIFKFFKKTTVSSIFIQKKKTFFLSPSLILENLNTSRYSLGLSYDFYQSELKTNFNKYRLLLAENQLVLPINRSINLITTSFDVIHSWFIPGLGLKFDCVPGRTTHHFMVFNTRGYYTGQCAEVCGRNHHHMPINLYIK